MSASTRARSAVGPKDTTDAVSGDASPGPIIAAPVTQLGRFALLEHLGQGGMGSVYAAYDAELDRRVALKLLYRLNGSNAQQRQHILREARAVARISHPNVIGVYEVGESAEHVYIAMEYVDGETLVAWQEHGGHSWREILEIYLAAGTGLAFAHSVGVVHRDFKPDNVLVGKDGRVRVADFGLARVDLGEDPVEEPLDVQDLHTSINSGRLTLPGVISGTPGYMSPEQYRGGDVDGRSDQWNFCAALFEALYGYKPFGGETMKEQAAGIHEPPRSRPRDTQVPQEIHRVLLRGLSKDREQRYPTMDDLLTELTLEHGDHAGANRGSRNLFLSLFFGTAFILLIILQLRNSQGILTLRGLAVAAGVMFAVVLSAGIYRRQTLLANRFHRAMWLICMLTITATVLNRTSAYVLGIPFHWLFNFEMILLATTLAVAGVFLIPWMLFAPLVPLLFAGLSLSGLIPPRFLTLAHPVILSLFVIGWGRAANQVGKPTSSSEKKLFPLLTLRSKSNKSANPSGRHSSQRTK